MRWRLELASLLGASWLACMIALPRPAFAQHEAAALLSRWMSSAPAAFEFVQERHLSILSHPIVSHGVVTRRADRTILWHQTDPIDKAIVIGPEGIQSGADEADAMPQALVASIAGAVVDILFGRTDRLTTLFDVTESDGQVVLVPKDKPFSEFMARIELDGASRLSKITLIEKSGDFTTITLTSDTAFSPQ